MEFRHLEYFVAVAEELHFRRAAARLHIVQPALSQQILRLEAELGVTLLERTKRHVELTEAGRSLLVDARALLERRTSAIEAARSAADGRSGHVDAGFVGPATYSVLPAVVRAFRGRHPDIDLRLHELTSAEQLDRIAAHTLDVGFVRMPMGDNRFVCERVLTEPMCVALPEGHPLCAHPAVALADLAPEPFIMVPRSREPAVFDRIVGLCSRAGFSPSVIQEAQQVHAMIGLVAIGLGVALVPESMGTLCRPDVSYRPLADAGDAVVETGLVRRPDDTAPAVRRFVETAREVTATASADP
ncbi:LysR family transcriptional regulator [Pseudonocardia sp. GCM10023141]|uniref:LysR family transcriptional regulator n=1 Tax=Pseudonocardia sp. GCM10023141 TaxID=3252653 RepID=UPI0036212B2D